MLPGLTATAAHGVSVVGISLSVATDTAVKAHIALGSLQNIGDPNIDPK